MPRKGSSKRAVGKRSLRSQRRYRSSPATPQNPPVARAEGPPPVKRFTTREVSELASSIETIEEDITRLLRQVAAEHQHMLAGTGWELKTMIRKHMRSNDAVIQKAVQEEFKCRLKNKYNITIEDGFFEHVLLFEVEDRGSKLHLSGFFLCPEDMLKKWVPPELTPTRAMHTLMVLCDERGMDIELTDASRLRLPLNTSVRHANANSLTDKTYFSEASYYSRYGFKHPHAEYDRRVMQSILGNETLLQKLQNLHNVVSKFYRVENVDIDAMRDNGSVPYVI